MGDLGAANEAPVVASASRRSLIRGGAIGVGGALAGALVSGGAVHYHDQHLSPTDRVAPRPHAAGLLAPRVIFQGSGERKSVCLTFDDGPDPRWTPRVLDMLEETGVRATFFVLGEAAQVHGELLEQEHKSGHEVAIHHWIHDDVYSHDYRQEYASVEATIEAITESGLPRPRLWRPPYGRVDAPALMVAAQLGVDLALWSHHTPSQADAASLSSSVYPGSIILAHDGRSQPNQGIIDAIGASVRWLREEGYQFLTVSQMCDEELDASHAGE